MTGSRRIIIDGYNVIRTNPSGSHIEQTLGGEAARQWLLDLCCRAVQPGQQWTLVFDGDGVGLSREAGGGTVTVRFAAPLTADELIRRLGCDAAALGAGCLIVSSDHEVRVDGCAFQDSAGFYDGLLRSRVGPCAQPTDDAGGKAEKLFACLAGHGHIAKDGFIPAATRDALTYFFMYFGVQERKPQKLARRVEDLLREGMRLSPDPDPEKEVFRTIKGFFETKK